MDKFKQFEATTTIQRMMSGDSVPALAAELTGLVAAMDAEHRQEALRQMETEVELSRLESVTNRDLVPWDMTHARLVEAVGKDNADLISKYREELRGLKGEAYRRKLRDVKGLVHRMARQSQKDQAKVLKTAERIERYDRIAAEVNRFLNGPLKLERLGQSYFRRLLDDEREGGLFTSVHKGREADYLPPDMVDLTFGQAAVFVVEHDWASAFASAPDVFDGPITLPDSHCVFEFSISGHVVIAAIGQIDDNPSILPFIRTKEGWVTVGSMMSRHGQIGTIKALDGNNLSILIHEAGDDIAGTFTPLRETADTHRLYTLIDRQVRAVGVALDAQVAVRTAVRMPYKSNQPPKGPAKPKPFYSYHTVSLARRGARLEAREDDGLQVPGPKRRLHFRRAHWRHFDGWKTKVNWTLVGDPDLGFVDKHYKL